MRRPASIQHRRPLNLFCRKLYSVQDSAGFLEREDAKVFCKDGMLEVTAASSRSRKIKLF